jgi:formylglycine-generating enzyme required for sulfatase activity/serine/threonine protein kinase
MRKGDVITERYELAELLGAGSGTLVFRAHDLLLGDEVAVKLFRAAALQNRSALKAYKRDIAVLRDNPHPNIVRILDFGEADRAPYIAMELIRGGPLQVKTKWPAAAALQLFEQLADALAWLHARGLVHGGIRVSNIIWNDGAMRLMDFGPQRNSRQAALDAPDSLCPYASPEQLLGRPLTAASDLYSAAAVVYHLLTSEPPHAEGTLAARTIAAAPRIRKRVPDVPDAIAEILERCLNPDPDQRALSATEVAEQCRLHRGGLLADRMGEEPLDPGEVLAVLLEVCRVLRKIHDAGLAHPDLSPRNIRLSGGTRVEIESLPAPPPNATLIVSEPKYAAPEVLLTHAASDGITHLRSDIYVLGFVAYEALTGRSAFHQLFGNSGEPQTDLFWMKWHADRAARVLPLHDVNPSVPAELSTLIQRMTEKDPAARLSSLDDLESALMQLQRRLQTTGEFEMHSVEGSPSSPSAPPAKVRSRPGKLLASMIVLTCLLACGGAAWWRWKPGSITRRSLIEYVRMAQKQISRTWSRAGDLRHRVMPASSLPVLPASIETASGPMVLVPAGRFVMGSSAVPNEAPVHTVDLPAFYIDKYEVSNGRYRAFTDSTGYSQPPAPSWDPDYFAKSSHPVLNVSWRDAQAFCVAAGKRLPTEAEWEKAARGSSPSSRSWANWTVAGLANLKRASTAAPAQVGGFAGDVSPFGAYDMAGNVHEWVNDDYRLYEGNPVSLERPANAKIVRGGSFALAPPDLSPSWRASLDPSIAPGTDSPVGFRCAADPGPAITPPRGPSRP